MSLLAKAFRILMLDRQAGKKSVSDMMTELRASKESILRQVSKASDTAGHREKMAHVIGIERWAMVSMLWSDVRMRSAAAGVAATAWESA